MQKVSAPVAELIQIVESRQFISPKIDHSLLKFFGVFILKNVFATSTIQKYATSYFEDLREAKLKRTNFHLTEIKLSDEHFLRQIIKESEFVKAVSSFFDGNVGVDFIRVVKKDKIDTKPVFRHQDTCYQIGGFERYSLFIPLTTCSYENGGLVLHPGTHNFGYLGDAGEILDILPKDYPRVESRVEPGDILIMHSGTWHQSPENSTGEDRVYLEVHIQHIDEPTTKIQVCGDKKSKWSLHLTEDEILTNSRTQRLRKLYKEIEELKARRAAIIPDLVIE
jgi:Phytanoyl-CoA dioxygenase (PhyH)